MWQYILKWLPTYDWKYNDLNIKLSLFKFSVWKLCRLWVAIRAGFGTVRGIQKDLCWPHAEKMQIFAFGAKKVKTGNVKQFWLKPIPAQSGQAHHMFSRYLNLRIIFFMKFYVSFFRWLQSVFFCHNKQFYRHLLSQ